MKTNRNRSATVLSGDSRVHESPTEMRRDAETDRQPACSTVKKEIQSEVEKLALVALFTDELVIITDASGLTEWVNPAMLRRSGYTFEEMVGRKPGSLFQGPETDQQAVARIRHAIREGRPIREQVLNYTKNREPYWVEIQISPVHGRDGRISQFVAIQRDITELQRTREQLIAAREKAEEGSRMRSLFLATVSHELRTPLNGLLGMTELLLETPLEELQREYVLTIQQAGWNLLDNVGDILDVSQIAAGAVDLRPRSFAVQPFIEEIRQVLMGKAQSRGLSFTYKIEETVAPCIEADPDRLRQILVNLIENGVKFTREGGVVLDVTLQATDPDKSVLVFRVSDTGKGICASDLPRLFRPFGQLDPSRSREQEGLGLGLTICQSLIHQMGGEIGVESQPGRGSVFSFAIPYLPRTDPRPAPEPGPVRKSFHNVLLPKVLLAEDNLVNQKITAALLNKLGFECDVANDGQAAVDAAHQNHYRIILMDIHMPRMDGLEATRMIRSDTSAEQQPYLMAVTADAGVEHQQLYLASGMDAVLAKPFSLLSLRKAMAAALRHLSGRAHAGALHTLAEI